MYYMVVYIYKEYIFVGWQARSGDLSRLKSSGQPDHIIGILQISNHDDILQ